MRTTYAIALSPSAGPRSSRGWYAPGSSKDRRPPTLQQISPYREALALFEYRVVEAPGETVGETLRVAHWVLLDGKAAPAGRAPLDRTYRLVLEPLAANPQVESLYLSDDLGSKTGGGELFFAPDPDLTPEG